MLVAGEVLAGRYQIERVLGQGGMGGVYLAVQLGLSRQVAVKQLVDPRRDPVRREKSAAQFRTEAQLLSQLRHPGLPEVYDFFQEDDDFFIVMEFIDGRTLEEEVLTRPALTEGQVLPWIQQLCEVLLYLHAHDPPVVFRDLKPSNVMVDREGRIRLIDFGIAKIFAGSNGVTQTAARGAGTPGFAAPEQYDSGTDFRSDIYSLGATLYFMLSRQAPPNAISLAMNAASLPPLRSLNRQLSAETARTIAWMMAIKPEERPVSVAEVMGALGLQPGSPTPLAKRRLAPRLAWLPAVLGSLAALLAFLHWALPTAPPPQARISVSSTPDGATVTVNDKVRGTTPLVVDALPPGTYEVHLALPSYQPTAQVVTLKSGEASQVTATLQPAGAGTGTVVVHGEDGTRVRVDGEPAGEVHGGTLTLTLPPGEHRLALGRSGYLPVIRPVTLQAGQSQQVDVTLEPLADMVIVPSQGVGPLKIGMSIRQVPQAVGGVVRQFRNGARVLAKPALGLSAWFRQGRVHILLVASPQGNTAPRLATAGGVHVGSAWSEVEAEFGTIWEQRELPIGPARLYSAQGIAFQVENDTVTGIAVQSAQPTDRREP